MIKPDEPRTPSGKECKTNADCPEGYKCVWSPHKGTWVCVKSGGGETACKSDDDCPTGYKCVTTTANGKTISKCVPKEEGEAPCKGGYKGKQIKGQDGKWHLLEKCKEGFIPKQASDGTIWCCPDPTTTEECQSDDDCPEGYRCVAVMINGKLTRRCKPKAEEECKSDADCPEGYECVKENPSDVFGKCKKKKEVTCTSNADCPEGQVCVDGKCVTPTEDGEGCEGGYKLADKPLDATGGSIWTDDFITAEMGFYRNSAHEGHYIHKGGRFYLLTDVHDAIQNGTTPVPLETTSACQKGYALKTINGVAWCCPAAGGDGGGAGTTFGWSSQLSALMKRLLGKADYLLDYPRGLTEAERQAIYNRAFEGIKGGERGRLQSMRNTLSRMGLLGTGFELEEEGKVRRATRGFLAGTKRDIAIEETQRRFNELMTTTGMAQNLAQLGLTSEQIEEAMNAARRGEGQQSMAMILSYLSQLMGGQAQAWNPYYQAIMTQMQRQPYQGSTTGAGADWLPWLGYYLSGSITK